VRIKTAVQALSVLLLLPAAAAAQPTTYKVDKVHSTVGFSIRHFVSDVEGRFKDFDGTITLDPAHPADATVQFTVQAASIATDNDDRDKHLRSPDFFDAEKYTTLTFASTKVVAKSANAFDVTGNLTIHGVTKTVTIPATFKGSVKTPMGVRAGFASSFKIDRKDYGVVWNRAMEGGGAMLGDEVEITIKAEAAPPKPPAATK
jgi:polyisoprenoid-binding protein YceI